jgi:hypothetical protein
MLSERICSKQYLVEENPGADPTVVFRRFLCSCPYLIQYISQLVGILANDWQNLQTLPQWYMQFASEIHANTQ